MLVLPSCSVTLAIPSSVSSVTAEEALLGWVVTGCPKSLPWPLQLTGILWGPEGGELLTRLGSG